MAQHFLKGLKHLNVRFQGMVNIIEDNFSKSMYALEKMDTELARQIIEDDTRIDEMEIEIEEECLKMLALHQPVAVDLREIVAILKINNDMERISDLTANLCSRIIRISEFQYTNLNGYLLEMGGKVKNIFIDSLNSYNEKDSQMALEIIKLDEEIDNFHSKIYTITQELMEQDSNLIPYCISCISMARFLERIADHATNIAEDAYYMIEAEIIRHRHDL